MQNSVKYFIILLLSLMFLAACGQKAPLFLPGNTNEIRPVTPPQQQAPDNEEDDEDEIPITNQT